MSEGKRNLVSCFGTSSVKKWNFESENKKRRIEDENSSSESVFRSNENHGDNNEHMTSTQQSKSDVDSSTKSKYVPKPFTAPLNSIIDKKLAAESLKTDDDELNSIDAYFASLEKKNEPYQRPRPPAGFRYLPRYISIFRNSIFIAKHLKSFLGKVVEKLQW